MTIFSPVAPFAAKLWRRSGLGPDDRTALATLPTLIERYRADDVIVTEGDRANAIGVLVAGVATSFKIVDDAAEQIVGMILTGDAVDLPSLVRGQSTAHVRATTACVVGWIDHTAIQALCQGRPSIAQALWLETLVEAAIGQEWIANLGQRSSLGRLVHFILEMAWRCEAIGALGADGSFELPLRQQRLAAVLGISLVHLNKTLGGLRAKRLLEWRYPRVRLLDRAGLEALVRFDGRYLHPVRPPIQANDTLPSQLASTSKDTININTVVNANLPERS